MVHGTVLSTELREFADTSLLFWSSFDFVFDAALNFFGPIDSILREPKEYPPSSSSLDYTTTTSNNNNNKNNDNNNGDLVGSGLLENNTLIRDAKTILTRFVRGQLGDAKESSSSTIDSIDEQEDDEEDECHKNAKSWTDTEPAATQNHNHSSLQVRGGGRGRQKFEFSLYQEGDGSASDPDGIPKRYLDMHGGDREKAKASLEASLEWRKDQKIDTILARPHPKFDICKQVFPTTFLGRDPDGHVIFMQRPALMDLELSKRNKLKKEDLLEHYIYINEYLWQIAEGDKPLGTMVSVLDLTGLNMGVLRKREYMSFLKLFVSVMDAHFPQRAHKTLIVNSPKWVNTIYRIVSPLLREETKSRIMILSKSKKQDDALKRYLGSKAAANLPASFWSKNKSRGKDQVAAEEPKHFPESEMDAKLRAHVSSTSVPWNWHIQWFSY